MSTDSPLRSSILEEFHFVIRTDRKAEGSDKVRCPDLKLVRGRFDELKDRRTIKRIGWDEDIERGKIPFAFRQSRQSRAAGVKDPKGQMEVVVPDQRHAVAEIKKLDAVFALGSSRGCGLRTQN